MKTTAQLLAVLSFFVACGDDDGALISDAGSPDAGSADAGSADVGSEVDQVLRFKAMLDAEHDFMCACEVMAGNYPDVNACIAEYALVTLSDEQILCLQGALEGASDEDIAMFRCENDAYQVSLECHMSHSCADVLLPTPSAVDCAIAELEAECVDVPYDIEFDACFM